MSFSAILALAVGLAADATAAAAARGLAAPQLGLREGLRVAALFGGFQALMPLAGWLLGRQIGPAVAAWDHWIAFALLGGLGVKAMWEAARDGAGDVSRRDDDPFDLRVLLVLAVATSLDAFAVGVTLPMLGAPLALSLATIGATTAVLSVVGLLAGRRFDAAFGRGLEALGGLVLLLLGGKILVEHLAGG
jgi:putative Mn2+ efflux pump MntP